MCYETGIGKVRAEKVGIYTRRNPDTGRGADVLSISNERYAQKKSSLAKTARLEYN